MSPRLRSALVALVGLVAIAILAEKLANGPAALKPRFLSFCAWSRISPIRGDTTTVRPGRAMADS